MGYSLIEEERVGAVVRLWMNRPEKRNAQTPAMLGELGQALQDAAHDRSVNVIILAGHGPSFSSGHDISHEARWEYGEDFLTRVDSMMEKEEEIYFDWTQRLHDLPKPTIAQVQGHCIMGGMMLATACDLIVAAEDAQFADMAVRWVAPCVEYNRYLYDMGARRAKEFLFTGDAMTASEAYRLGLVNRVVPNDQLTDETLALAKRIARNDPFINKLAKKVINDGLDAMGFRAYLRGAFYMHHLAHSSMKLTGWPAGIPKDGESVGQWARERDAAHDDSS